MTDWDGVPDYLRRLVEASVDELRGLVAEHLGVRL